MKCFITMMMIWMLTAQAALGQPAPIDRQALVSRHNVVLSAFEGERPMQVGNGEFAFGMDVTGLQTFAAFNTMSHWGWNSSPLPAGVRVEDYQMQVVRTHGRDVLYPLADPKHPALSAWLAGNPHAVNLGRVGFVLMKADGSVATVADLKAIRQELDLWTGVVTSSFELEGQPVMVMTACHPEIDAIAASVKSPLVSAGQLAVFLDGSGDDPRDFANFVGDPTHAVELEVLPSADPRRANFLRALPSDHGKTETYVAIAWSTDAALRAPAPRPSLKIIKAEYGAGDHWADVTELALKAVSQDRLQMHADNAALGDPAKGSVKTLRVTYEASGKMKTAEVGENATLLIDTGETPRRYTLHPAGTSDALSFTVAFAPKPLPNSLPVADETIDASRKHWASFWKSGGAIDLSGSRDPRWKELERRIVLSQYLMAVNEAGSNPPQESGLVNNGWFGRFHLEMAWWHEAHAALWDRWPQVERSMGIYSRIMPGAKRLATTQGYEGARWPKCIGPDGREWPFTIHSFLIWQQPHPIFFAELDYRAHPDDATLKKWWPVVEATADFMATYPHRDLATGVYSLGPPLQVVSENADDQVAHNPTFELSYWRFGLRTAIAWRKRLNLAPKPAWDDVLAHLATLPQKDETYLLMEGVENMWTKFNFEHPAFTGAFGMLPGDGVDPATMHRTFDKVMTTWNWQRTWGWDYPMLAMCAARLGERSRAIDLLLTSNEGFQFDERGLATGGPFPYFPSNGGLLYAVAMMAAGWDGAPKGNAPGFPEGGQWEVRWEGLKRAP